METWKIRDAIHKMEKDEQIQILDFFVKKGVKTNGNKSGVFINLTALSAELLGELSSLTDSLISKNLK